MDAKFVANGSGAGGEAAFGDNATIAQYSSDPGSPSGYYNNNSSSLAAPTATDTATSASPWSFGALDSGHGQLRPTARRIRSARMLIRIRSIIISRVPPAPVGRPDIPVRPSMETGRAIPAWQGLSAAIGHECGVL